jgi:hypothetical protein
MSILVARSKSIATSMKESEGATNGVEKECVTALVSASNDAKACVT